MSIYQSILRVQLNEAGRSLRIFWAIWLLILITSYAVATLAVIEEFFFVSFVPAIVWIAFYTFKAVSSDLPYVLKLGASRKQLIAATAVLVVGLSIFMTAIHFVVTELFERLAAAVDAVQPIVLVNLTGSNSLTLLQGLLFDIIVCIFVGAVMVLLAVLYVRFGKIPLYLAGAVLLILLPIPYVQEHLFEWIQSIQNGDIFASLLVFLLAAVLCVLISRLMVTKVSLR